MIVLAGESKQRRTLTRGSSYLSSRDASLHVGTGTADAVEVIVTWPDGFRERFEDVPAGRETNLTRGIGTPWP